MKIIYIGTKYDFGKQSRGYGYGYVAFYNTLINMNDGKHEVVSFFYDEVMAKLGPEKMNQQLIETVRSERPDLCFFLVSYELTKKTIAEITRLTKTFNWFTDDHWQFEIFSKNFAKLFDYVGTTDFRSIEKYHNIGYKNVIKTQWGYNHYMHRPIKSKKHYGITFVGQNYGNRGKIINVIKSNNFKVSCYGNGWKNKRVSEHTMNEIFTNSEINLNFANSSFAPLHFELPGIFIRKDISGKVHIRERAEYIPRIALLVKKRRPQIKARVFEVIGCGGLLLTAYVEELEKYYSIDKEIVIFNDTKEMMNKLEYLHNELNEKERRNIARAGYLKTLKEHTYEKRFNDIFKEMGLR